MVNDSSAVDRVARRYLYWTLGRRLGTLIAATVVAWFRIERDADVPLRKILGESLYRRLHGAFKETRVWHRLIPAALFILAWFITSMIAGPEAA